MKIAFVVYHDILEDRISNLLEELKIDYFTEWDNVKGKGHKTEPHLGSRTFPGYNYVKMIAFEKEELLQSFCEKLCDINKEIIREDDKIRLFQLPLEKMI